MTAPRQPGTPSPGAEQPGSQPARSPQPGSPTPLAGPAGAAPQIPEDTQIQAGLDPRIGRFQTTPPPGRVPAVQQRQPVDIATRLDGQRGWLMEIDRSLKKRSIIALLLTCLAVGVGAAALYISITKNADGDRITALDERVKALEDASVSGSTTTGTLPDSSTTTPDSGSTSTDTAPDTTTPDTGTTTPDTGTTTPLPSQSGE